MVNENTRIMSLFSTEWMKLIQGIVGSSTRTLTLQVPLFFCLFVRAKVYLQFLKDLHLFLKYKFLLQCEVDIRKDRTFNINLLFTTVN